MIRVPAWQGSGEGLFLDFKQPSPPMSCFMKKEKRANSCVSPHKDTNLPHEVSLRQTVLPASMTLEVRILVYDLRRHQCSVCINPRLNIFLFVLY